MLFGHHTIDKTFDEHVTEVAAFASDPQTLIFLDTNILAYLYKLHDGARREFFAWTDTVTSAGRLAVPAWAASEYLAAVTSKTLESYSHKGKEPSAAKKALEALFETASLFVDDSALRKIAFAGDRDAFLTGFRKAIDAATSFTRVFSHQFDPGAIHGQIDAHLSSAVLASDLSALCVRASQEGDGRFEQRIPPGFRDDAKPENRLGDLIIWFEIMEKSADSAAKFSKVLFISRDEKSDWVYAPKMRKELVRGGRKSIGNASPEIRLADPRLVAEFERKAGHPNFVVTSLATLVEGLSRHSAADFGFLAAAIQINVQAAAQSVPPASDDASGAASSELAETTSGQATPQPPIAPASVPTTPAVPLPEAAPTPPAEPIQPRLQYDADALQDGQYEADVPSTINSVIRALKSLNWYTQNPAIATIRSIRQEVFSPSSWFVLGRNVYQSACGNSQKAMEFMAALDGQLRQFPDDTAQHLLAGILYEVYFDGQGQFRHGAKFGYADKPLSLVTEEHYVEALEFIRFHLWPYRDRLKFMPGDSKKMIIRIVSAPLPTSADETPMDGAEFGPAKPTSEIRSVTLDGIELMRNVGDDVYPWDVGSTRLSSERIRDEISGELAIPKWALAMKSDPPAGADLILGVPDGRQLDSRLALQTGPSEGTA